MIKIATLVALVACLTVIGCQPPEGMAGPTKEEFDALKMQVETMKTDLDNATMALETLQTDFSAHMQKYHKVTVKTTKPPETTTSEPPPRKVK
jgi:hypothetical protein